MLPALDRIVEKLRALAHEHAPICRCSRARTASRPRPRRSARRSRTSSRGSRARAHASPRCAARQDERRGRQLQRASRRVSGRRLGSASRARFVTSLGLEFNPYTIQIEPHDAIAELFDAYAAREHGAARSRPRRLGLHLARLFQAEARRRAKSAPRPCRTRSTRSTSRTPKATSASPTRCCAT